jgi:DICT domain-containing protein
MHEPSLPDTSQGQPWPLPDKPAGAAVPDEPTPSLPPWWSSGMLPESRRSEPLTEPASALGASEPAATFWRPAALPPLRLGRNEPPGLTLRQMIASLAATARFGTSTAEQVLLPSVGSWPPFEGTLYFYHDVPTLLRTSHLIEDRVVAGRLRAEVYAGFQRLSRLEAQHARYAALLEHVRYIFAFGLQSTSTQTGALQHPRLVRFALGPHGGSWLEWLWFVVVDHPELTTALVARQVDDTPWSPPRPGRRYAGLWTTDPTLTTMIIALLRQSARALYAGS